MLSASANEVVKSETTYFIRLSGKEISLTVSLSICLSFHVFSFTSCTFYSLFSPDRPTSVCGDYSILIRLVSLNVVGRTSCELTR